jgi:hypothetical protein
MVGTGGVRWQKECTFLCQVPLKPTLLYGMAGPGDSQSKLKKWGGFFFSNFYYINLSKFILMVREFV